ncbi:hypothetical protein LTR86_010901 [Recurvomyces mirabilis]|nr:hypothetical protein LTR86_010901 [Recurvomyces mirabilis]
MAVSLIEEKILGKLAKYSAPSNALLSASLYQVLGLSILLSRKLVKAQRVRRLDMTRDTKSLKLYHHIIWLAREGLSITEVYILPYCQNGEQGPECRVMAAKLRASLYHVFCLFHNHPPISAMSPRSLDSDSPPSSGRAQKAGNERAKRSPGKSPRDGDGREYGKRRRRAGSSGLRDPIPSMTSEASYVTNPFAGPAQTPPPPGPPPPVPLDARRTPERPPGLARIEIPSPQASAAFLLPPLNYVPMAKEHFETAQQLATSLLPPANALRLSIALEYSAFLSDCEKQHERSVRVAARAVRAVYASKDGLDDDEFADAAELVKALALLVKRGTMQPSTQPSKEALDSPKQSVTSAPLIDRTIAVSPSNRRNKTRSPLERGPRQRTPDRLSTVAEDVSAEATSSSQTLAPVDPPLSRLSDKGALRKNSASSATSDKAAKRRALEAAEEIYRRDSASGRSQTSGGSRQATPAEGSQQTTTAQPPPQDQQSTTNQQTISGKQPQIGRPYTADEQLATDEQPTTDLPQLLRRDMTLRTSIEERRLAILMALKILTSVSEGLRVPERSHGGARALRMI